MAARKLAKGTKAAQGRLVRCVLGEGRNLVDGTTARAVETHGTLAATKRCLTLYAAAAGLDRGQARDVGLTNHTGPQLDRNLLAAGRGLVEPARERVG